MAIEITVSTGLQEFQLIRFEIYNLRMKPYKRVVEFTFDTDFTISLTLVYNLSQKGKISASKGYKEYCDYYLLPKTG